MTDVMTCFFF